MLNIIEKYMVYKSILLDKKPFEGSIPQQGIPGNTGKKM
jgi:hypothetical protein